MANREVKPLLENASTSGTNKRGSYQHFTGEEKAKMAGVSKMHGHVRVGGASAPKLCVGARHIGMKTRKLISANLPKRLIREIYYPRN